MKIERDLNDVVPAGFQMQKVRRKLESDGVKSTAITATELFVRKRLARSILDPLIDWGVVQVLSRRELARRALESVEITEEAGTGSSRLISRLESGYVLSETGLVVTDDFEVLAKSVDTQDRTRQAMMAMCSREMFFGCLPVQALLGIDQSVNAPEVDMVAPLIPRYPANYYHWMVETVPKVKYLREFEQQTGSQVTLLVALRAPPFVMETLSLLDWPEERILRASEPIYKVRDLIVPPYPERTRAEFEWLRRTILDAISPTIENPSTSSGARIYVSRENAVSRRAVNESAVMDVLDEYGFERYLLEDQSLEENASLFANADIVVGPHGAGLTDILFAEDCTLVELFGARLNKAYEKLSDTLGIRYEPIYCEADGSDILVDTEELEERIAALVQ